METMKMIQLAGLPDHEWRTLCSAMAFYLRNPDYKERHPMMVLHFPDKMPTLKEWTTLRRMITELRLTAEETMSAGQQLSRTEYMRLYMKRRRIEQGV